MSDSNTFLAQVPDVKTVFSDFKVLPVSGEALNMADPGIGARFSNFNISDRARNDARAIIALERRELINLNWATLSQIATVLGIEHKKSTVRDYLIEQIRARLAE